MNGNGTGIAFMSAWLVCEGACNHGRVDAFDKALRTDHNRKTSEKTRVGGIDDRLASLARMFTYTRHYYRDGGAYRCDVCGTVRKFG